MSREMVASGTPSRRTSRGCAARAISQHPDGLRQGGEAWWHLSKVDIG
jgi:hypothetical protein